MSFGLPDSVKIGALHYEIIEVDDRNFEHGKNNTGTCNTAFQKIWLEVGKRRIEGVWDDLLHEIVEAINDQCDLGMKHQDVSTLATTLHQVLRDSKLTFHSYLD